MVPIQGEWTPFADLDDQLEYFRAWGLVPPKSKKLRPILVVDGYFGTPRPCKVVGHQGESWAVIELEDGLHAIHGEYLAEMQPSAMQKLPTGACFAEILSDYIVVDIETTGFDIRDDRILEIAAIRCQYGKEVDSFHTLVQPGRPVPPEIQELTGITTEDVADAPALADAERPFLDFIGALPLVGHNALTFDVPFLSQQLSRPLPNYVLDTLPMARRVFELLPCHKLAYLDKTLGLGSAGAHRALHDVRTTNALLWACMAPRNYEAAVNRAFLDHRLSQEQTPKKAKRSSRASGKKMPENIAKTKYNKVDIKSITPTGNCPATSGPLCGKAMVFTGELTIPREQAMQMAVDAGAVLKTSVSKKTAYLVVGKQDPALVGRRGVSGKELKARELNETGNANIQIITEEEFLKLAKKEGAAV